MRLGKFQNLTDRRLINYPDFLAKRIFPERELERALFLEVERKPRALHFLTGSRSGSALEIPRLQKDFGLQAYN